MQLKVSSLEAWTIFKAIVKTPNKVPCNLDLDNENGKVFFYGSGVSYLFQMEYLFVETDQFNIQLPYTCIERLAKLKKKDISTAFAFGIDSQKHQVVVQVLTALDIVEMTLYFDLSDEYEHWEEFYKPDFLNDLCFLTPDHVASIGNVVKNQTDLNYHLFLPEGFCAVGDYQFTVVELGLESDAFASTPVNLPSTLLNAVLAVDPQLAIGGSNGDYLKSESYCVTLPPPKTKPSEANLFTSEKVNFVKSIFEDKQDLTIEIKLDDCAGIAAHIEKAATVDATFDLCELDFSANNKSVEVRFYKDLVVASETSFILLEEPQFDLTICLRTKNLISTLKMAKLDATLKFIDESSPILFEIDELTKSFVMTSILIKDESD